MKKIIAIAALISILFSFRVYAAEGTATCKQCEQHRTTQPQI